MDALGGCKVTFCTKIRRLELILAGHVMSGCKCWVNHIDDRWIDMVSHRV